MASQKQAYDAWQTNSALNHAVVRTTKNQIGTVTGGVLDGFAINGGVPQTFSVIKTVTSGIPWANRDAIDKEWLTAMGMEGVQYFQPEFNIVKCVWNGASPANTNWMFFQQLLNGSCQTIASYAKLVSGNCYGNFFEGITNKVQLCGRQTGRGPNYYYHPHPYITTVSGEVHFALLGAVLGSIPLNNPANWGFFQSQWAQSSTDTV